MAAMRELLVCGCQPNDVTMLRECVPPGELELHAVESTAALVRLACGRPPAALILGIGHDTADRLEVIPALRQVWPDLSVVVVAEKESLELEREARRAGILYFSVHPLEETEARAVLEGLARRC